MACDVANSVADIWFRLGFLSAAELATNALWLTLTELYQFGDDAAKRLSHSAAVFLVVDASINVLAATPSYPLPAAHVFTVMAWIVYSGAPVQILRPTSVGQLFALDANWAATTGSPTRVSLDAAPVGNATLYPIPIAIGTLDQICQEFPAIAYGSSSVPVCPLLQDYFSYALLAGALDKESDNAKPEVAMHCQERMKLYEAVAVHLWGPGV
jgi:hypothetical protein